MLSLCFLDLVHAYACHRIHAETSEDEYLDVVRIVACQGQRASALATINVFFIDYLSGFAQKYRSNSTGARILQLI